MNLLYRPSSLYDGRFKHPRCLGTMSLKHIVHELVLLRLMTLNLKLGVSRLKPGRNFIILKGLRQPPFLFPGLNKS